jgi:hypothetical protein
LTKKKQKVCVPNLLLLWSRTPSSPFAIHQTTFNQMISTWRAKDSTIPLDKKRFNKDDTERGTLVLSIRLVFFWFPFLSSSYSDASTRIHQGIFQTYCLLDQQLSWHHSSSFLSRIRQGESCCSLSNRQRKL